MYFKEIEVSNFRNYIHEKVSFHRKVNVFIGSNAQGKTNLLESLYLTSLGKSFRSFHDRDMIRFGSDIGRTRAVVDKDGEEFEIEIGLISSGKSIKIDGISKKKTSDILEYIYVVMFSPEDLRIIKDDPSHRRRFIDRELCRLKPVYLSDLSKYNKILRQRNFLLKKDGFEEELLNIWDNELSIYGSKVIQERNRFINILSEISGDIYRGLTENRESISVAYESDIEIAENYREQQTYFMDALKSNRKNDISKRITNKGPHHDDVVINVNDVPVRKFGSQGQQRSAALSLKLAEIEIIKKETGEIPVVLLDDVLSELDDMRQKKLINLFNDTQIFITSTEFEDKLASGIGEHALFRVDSGKVERIY